MMNSFLHDMHFQNLTTVWIIVLSSVVVLCFVVSEITRNYSQVDKLWSLMPIAYSWITAAASPSPRILVMAALVTLWGLRLSYNFYRKGGYHRIPWKGAEDYRWQVMREHPLLKGRLRFGLFNLLFISLYQNLLILLFTSPMLLASLYPEKSLTILDLFSAILMLTFIILESVADNQQFAFQQEKRFGKQEGSRYPESHKKGFLTEGFWRYARHPNFASEQGLWISFYFFGVAASGRWINLTVIGALLLVLLFIGSTRLTERLSSKKYSAYAVYRKEVPKFIPRLADLFRKK